MRLTTKCRHAITALIHVANQADAHSSVSLAEISRVQGVSLSYLEQLFARLRKHEIVTGTRGPGGGYRLNGSPRDITIARVMDAIEDRSIEERMRSFSSSRPDSLNFAQNMWNDFSRELYEYLDQINLERFIQNPDEQQAPQSTGLASLTSRLA